jgi:hypothetical protein
LAQFSAIFEAFSVSAPGALKQIRTRMPPSQRIGQISILRKDLAANLLMKAEPPHGVKRFLIL